MKKTLVPSLIALALGSVSGWAQAQAAAAPESSLSFNVGATTDYRYRGISQSRLQPALQGGVDYADKSGFYLGAWGSTIQFIKDSGAAKGNIELDLYGGYKGAAGAVAYDVGFLRYEYVGNKLGDVPLYANANTTEVYGAATIGMVTAKTGGNVFAGVDSYGLAIPSEGVGSGQAAISAGVRSSSGSSDASMASVGSRTGRGMSAVSADVSIAGRGFSGSSSPPRA